MMTIHNFDQLMADCFNQYPDKLILDYREDDSEYSVRFDFEDCKEIIEQFGAYEVNDFLYDSDQDKLYVKLGDVR